MKTESMTLWDLFLAPDLLVSWASFVGTTIYLLDGKKRTRRKMFVSLYINYMLAVYMAYLIAFMVGTEIVMVKAAFGMLVGVGGFKIVERIINKLFDSIGTTTDIFKNRTDYGNDLDNPEQLN